MMNAEGMEEPPPLSPQAEGLKSFQLGQIPGTSVALRTHCSTQSWAIGHHLHKTKSPNSPPAGSTDLRRVLQHKGSPTTV